MTEQAEQLTETPAPAETFEERMARLTPALATNFEYERITLESVQNLRKEIERAEGNPQADHDIAFYCAKSFVYLKRWAELNKPKFVAEIAKAEQGDAAERLVALERLIKAAGLG
jgi:hypothetical protein